MPMIDFRFAYPYVFLLLIPMLLLVWQRERKRANANLAVLRYSDTRLLSGLPPNFRIRLRRTPDLLQGFAWLLILVALARPQFGDDTTTISSSGVDIVFALDISNSMATGDFNGLSRLDAAKSVITDFVNQRTSDRIGLVVFAEDAYYQIPLTLDYTLFNRILNNVTFAQQLGISNLSALGTGIISAANMLENSVATSKVIILITDGANNAGTIDPLTASQALRALNMKLYTIGMVGADSNNELDQVTLQRIAVEADGRDFDASNIEDFNQIYQTIDQLERSNINRMLNVTWQDRAFLFMGIALMLLILEQLLRHTVFQTIP
jgi:Ca-activated chloride channel homolog